jgi:hypothetical protein
MTPEVSNLFTQFIQEISTKSSALVVEASKHTGIFVSFYDIGNTTLNIFKSIFH